MLDDNAICIIQARMGSSRLPGKVLRPLYREKAVLWYVVTRTQRAKKLARTVVATSTKSQDDAIAEFCQQHQFACFRGDEGDVLLRYYLAAKEHNASIIVRVTSDCPLIDPQIIDDLISQFTAERPDYLSNVYPKRYHPQGFDAEVFSFSALAQAQAQTQSPHDREHVTPYFYRNPQLFRLGLYQSQLEETLSGINLSIDTESDLQRVSSIYSALYPENREFGVREVIAHWRKNS